MRINKRLITHSKESQHQTQLKHAIEALLEIQDSIITIGDALIGVVNTYPCFPNIKTDDDYEINKLAEYCVENWGDT